jgi:hypothetical protein
LRQHHAARRACGHDEARVKRAFTQASRTCDTVSRLHLARAWPRCCGRLRRYFDCYERATSRRPTRSTRTLAIAANAPAQHSLSQRERSPRCGAGSQSKPFVCASSPASAKDCNSGTAAAYASLHDCLHRSQHSFGGGRRRSQTGKEQQCAHFKATMCSRTQRRRSSREQVPAATPMMICSASSTDASSSRPFSTTKVSSAAWPMRLFPSTNG